MNNAGPFSAYPGPNRTVASVGAFGSDAALGVAPKVFGSFSSQPFPIQDPTNFAPDSSTQFEPNVRSQLWARIDSDSRVQQYYKGEPLFAMYPSKYNSPVVPVKSLADLNYTMKVKHKQWQDFFSNAKDVESLLLRAEKYDDNMDMEQPVYQTDSMEKHNLMRKIATGRMYSLNRFLSSYIFTGGLPVDPTPLQKSKMLDKSQDSGVRQFVMQNEGRALVANIFRADQAGQTVGLVVRMRTNPDDFANIENMSWSEIIKRIPPLEVWPVCLSAKSYPTYGRSDFTSPQSEPTETALCHSGFHYRDNKKNYTRPTSVHVNTEEFYWNETDPLHVQARYVEPCFTHYDGDDHVDFQLITKNAHFIPLGVVRAEMRGTMPSVKEVEDAVSPPLGCTSNQFNTKWCTLHQKSNIEISVFPQSDGLFRHINVIDN
jgi:hypothetical protein